MAIVLPVVGTALVGAAVGALLALVGERPLVRGAVWGVLAGAAFGAAAAVVLALSPG